MYRNFTPPRDAECPISDLAVEGAVRVTAGVGSPCDPLQAGIVEIFHAGEWGGICGGDSTLANDFFAVNAPQVICRELGFLFGIALPSPPPTTNASIADSIMADGPAPTPAPGSASVPGRIWLTDAVCEGDELLLSECHMLPDAFLDPDSPESTNGCGGNQRLLTVACRQFAISEEEMAVEAAMAPMSSITI